MVHPSLLCYLSETLGVIGGRHLRAGQFQRRSQSDVEGLSVLSDGREVKAHRGAEREAVK